MKAIANRGFTRWWLLAGLLAADACAIDQLVIERDGKRLEIPVGNVVRAFRPNTLGRIDRVGLYLSRLWEFLSADPRESNTEGGIFPAIFGTVMMVFLMTVIVVPFGPAGAWSAAP